MITSSVAMGHGESEIYHDQRRWVVPLQPLHEIAQNLIASVLTYDTADIVHCRQLLQQLLAAAAAAADCESISASAAAVGGASRPQN